MINIKDIQKSIAEEVHAKVCDMYGLAKEEVMVNFKSDGDIRITISPKRILENLSATVRVHIEDGGKDNGSED